MKFLRCPYNYSIYPFKKGEKYCSAKLPCGRCVYKPICGDIPFPSKAVNMGICYPTYNEFNCDGCQYRFVCWTMRYDDQYWGANNEIVKIIKERV